MYIDVPLSFAIDFYDLQHGFFATHPCSFILTQVLMALIHFLTSILYCFLHLLLLFYYFLHFYYSFKDLHEFALQRYVYIYFFYSKATCFFFFLYTLSCSRLQLLLPALRRKLQIMSHTSHTSFVMLTIFISIVVV